MRFRWLALLTCLLLALPTVQAHAPPPAKEYETRILTDYNDDWFGTQDGHNLVSLDVREAYNATLADYVMIFRLMISGGYAPAPVGGGSVLSDRITFKADGTEKELSFETADNVAFTGTFDAVYGPEPVLVDGAQDGDRVFVTGVSRFSNLGILPGSKLTEWFVEGFADDADGDRMPEGLAPGAPEPPGTGGQVWSDIGEYTVRAPDYYVSIVVDNATLHLAGPSGMHDEETSVDNATGHEGAQEGNGHDEAGGENATMANGRAIPSSATINVTVSNLLAETPQTLRVQATATGLALDFGAGSSKVVDLAAGASQIVQLTITTANATGTIPVHVMATSNLDGAALAMVPVEVAAPPAPGNTTGDHDDGEDHHEDDEKDTPGFSGIVAVSLLAAIAIARRRR
jgi:hypothetical protein